MDKTYHPTDTSSAWSSLPMGEGGGRGFFTLITCTYNAASVLQRTLDSVLHQTYPDIEHIIIDGKSKDDTVRMAQQYKALSDSMHTGHRIIIVSEPDKGLYDAMNKGIQKATGQYLCFLNAGDMLAEKDTIARIAPQTAPQTAPQPPKGESLKNAFADDNAIQPTDKTNQQTPPLGGGGACGAFGVLYGQTDIVDDQGNFLRHRRLQAPEVLTWRSFRHGMLVCHQAFYANTAIAKQTPYNLHYKLSADVDWCIRIMKKAEEQGLTNFNTHLVLCKYLAGGMSVKNHRASLKERFMVMRSHYGLLDTICLHVWFIIRAVLKK